MCVCVIYLMHILLFRKCKYKIQCRNHNGIYSGYNARNYYLNFKSHINSKMTKQKRLKYIGKPKNCPMRIAELAMPNKRRCLETWKEKCNVLPNFIVSEEISYLINVISFSYHVSVIITFYITQVERLKKQVINQTPVVQIPEAIYCFKKAKNSSALRCVLPLYVVRTFSCSKVVRNVHSIQI